MALGIDIYDRYQDVTDWAAVQRHGVRFVYIKGTDGGGAAVVRADSFVRGVKSVGLPAGLYHYAQPTPSPEAQADVLVREVRRLGANGLPPALDLEGPFHNLRLEAASDFAQRFLRRVRASGFDRVTIYANTSFLSRLRPDRWAIPGLLIWAADYGANTGIRNPDLRPYSGRADIHQYTDRGTVPGIVGRVDLNESLTDILREDDVSLADLERVIGAYYATRVRKYGPESAENHLFGQAVFDIEEVLGDVYRLTGKTIGEVVVEIANELAALSEAVAELKARLAPDPTDTSEDTQDAEDTEAVAAPAGAGSADGRADADADIAAAGAACG